MPSPRTTSTPNRSGGSISARQYPRASFTRTGRSVAPATPSTARAQRSGGRSAFDGAAKSVSGSTPSGSTESGSWQLRHSSAGCGSAATMPKRSQRSRIRWKSETQRSASALPFTDTRSVAKAFSSRPAKSSSPSTTSSAIGAPC